MLAGKLLESIPPSIRIIRQLSTESVGQSLTLQQLRILKLISEGQGQTQIAQTLHVSLAAVSKTSDALKKKNLISKKAGPDRRTFILKLTPKGEIIMDQVTAYVKERLDLGIKQLSKQAKADLMKGLIVLDHLMTIMKEV